MTKVLAMTVPSSVTAADKLAEACRWAVAYAEGVLAKCPATDPVCAHEKAKLDQARAALDAYEAERGQICQECYGHGSNVGGDTCPACHGTGLRQGMDWRALAGRLAGLLRMARGRLGDLRAVGVRHLEREIDRALEDVAAAKGDGHG